MIIEMMMMLMMTRLRWTHDVAELHCGQTSETQGKDSLAWCQFCCVWVLFGISSLYSAHRGRSPVLTADPVSVELENCPG